MIIIYIAKFVPQSISLNSDFSIASWSMTVLSSGTDDITALSGVTIGTASSVTIGVVTYINQTVTYNELQLRGNINLNN